jgi:hypothetical protein
MLNRIIDSDSASLARTPMEPRSRVPAAMLIALAPMFVGCFLAGSEERPDDSRSGFHDVTVSWTLRNLDGSVMTQCPAGYTTIYANLYESWWILQPPPDAEVRVPCTPQGSFTRPVATEGELRDTAEGSYGGYFPYHANKDLMLRVTEETLSSVAASTETANYPVAALTSDLSVDFDLYPDGGVAMAAWQLQSSLTSAPLTSCAGAGVDEIEAAIRPFADESAPLVVAATWPCDSVDEYIRDFHASEGGAEEYVLGAGATAGLAPGSYFVELRAKRAGAVVGTVDGDVEISEGNTYSAIRPAMIPIGDR